MDEVKRRRLSQIPTQSGNELAARQMMQRGAEGRMPKQRTGVPAAGMQPQMGAQPQQGAQPQMGMQPQQGAPVMPGAQTEPAAPAVGVEQIRKLNQILEKYKAGKSITERRIVSSENWWKLRNSMEEDAHSNDLDSDKRISGFRSRSAWMHNVINNKHADAMEAFPEPNLRAREQGDVAEAAILTSIIPCILEQVDFEQVYSDVQWQKGKTGTGVYKVTWDSHKYNGLGDINISRANLLNIYWEPGVTDIQRSRYFFSTELVDKELLEEMHPELSGKLGGSAFLSTRFLYDDSVSTEGKVTVVECYYHRMINGRRTLQYVKYCGESVIYATENLPDMRERGLYDHGLFPYVFDPLFPIEGSPCGYGYVDICRNPQEAIDQLNTSFVINAKVGATPRYFSRTDGAVNVDEFLDLNKAVVHVNGNLGEDSLRQINFNSLDGVYVNLYDRIINELRETSGNTETATGKAVSGVTAASAIAALQEASGKGSRDATLTSYRAYTQLIKLVIELIRQFYDAPRQFRIVGQTGAEHFVTYSNAGIAPQAQGSAFGQDMGFRVPEFDIKVSAQKKNVYTKVSQNELALQFFQLGFFNPQVTDQALACLQLMDFDGKDNTMQLVSQNGSMFQKLTQYMQLSLQLAQIAAPQMVQGISGDIMQTLGVPSPAPAASGGEKAELTSQDNVSGSVDKQENPMVERARAQSHNAYQPDGGQVTGGAKG